MNDRLISLFGGIAALLIIIALLLPPRELTLENDSRPTTTDRGIHGLQGLRTWLDHNRIPSISLRRRYTSLQIDPRLSDSGNLIVISIPQTTEPSRAELDALADWIVQGNHVLLLGAISDRPPWSLAGGNALESLPRALGFELTSPSTGEAGGEAGSEEESLSANLHEAGAVLLGEDRQTLSLEPVFDHPLLEQVGSVATYRSLIHDAPQTILAGVHGPRQALLLLRRDDPPGAALWEFRAGGGGGWFSSHPDLFGNVTLGLADNARLFAHMAASALGEDGHIIFDDMHFGVSDLYDPDNFFRDPRLHNTLLFLGLFWLLYLFGYSNRLAPPTQRDAPPRASEFVEAMAGFFARRMNSVAAGRKILEHFHSDIRSRYRAADPRTPARELLRNASTVREGDLRDLDRLEHHIAHNRKTSLLRLTRTIDRITRTLP
jgi:hypothetical protein